MPERHLHIVVPGLFGPVKSKKHPGPDPTRNLDIPSLLTLLAKSDHLPAPKGYKQRSASGAFESLVFQLFGVATNSQEDLPIAAVTRVADAGVIDNDWWLRADPVHLQTRGDGLILSDGYSLGLSQQEADQLVQEIMEVYAEDGWLLKAPQPERWYLRPPKDTHIHTHPLADVIGHNIHDYLPGGPDGKAWHTILNEMQILLHTSNVNAERENRGLLAANSLWFWGGGRLPQVGEVEWAQVWSDEPLSQGLARVGMIPASPTPEDAATWFNEASLPDAHLLVLDQGRTTALYHEVEGWQEFMQSLEARWIAPCLAALKDNALQSLTLHAEAGRGFRLTRKNLKRWWRWRRPLLRYR